MCTLVVILMLALFIPGFKLFYDECSRYFIIISNVVLIIL